MTTEATTEAEVVEPQARCKRIFCVTTHTTYPSTKAAAEALGVRASNITSVLKRRAKTAGGFSFEYAEAEPAIRGEPQTQARAIKLKTRVGASCKKIFCDTNATFYHSIADAAEALGLHANNISACLNDRRQNVKGFTFYYVSEKHEPSCYQEEGEDK